MNEVIVLRVRDATAKIAAAASNVLGMPKARMDLK